MMSANLHYIIELLTRYMNNEDVAPAALGLVEALYFVGTYIFECMYVDAVNDGRVLLLINVHVYLSDFCLSCTKGGD